MNISLQHFRLIETISKEGTLTKSALTLHLTQSALSHQLKELERILGTEIFSRQGKMMHLTENGTRFLQSAEKILAEIKSLQEDLSNFKSGKTGKINISTQSYTAYHWLPEIIKNYQRESPDTNIHILSEASKRPLEFLLHGELDVAIVRSQMTNTKITYVPVYLDQLMVVMSKSNPLARKQVFEIADFEDTELIMPVYDASYQDTPLIEHMIQVEHIKLKNLHRIHYTDVTVDMAEANLGIGIMPDWIVKPYLKNRDIVAIPVSTTIAKRPWYAATCKDTPAINNFVKCLKAYFDKEQPVNDKNVLPAGQKKAGRFIFETK
jgi:LysR family transcriptional regulator for metE and metH